MASGPQDAWLDGADQRLRDAEDASDEERLALLEELHAALERELDDPGQAAPSGR